MKNLAFIFVAQLCYFIGNSQPSDSLLEKKQNKWVKPVAIAAGYAASTFFTYKYLDRQFQDESQEGKSRFKNAVASFADPFGLGKNQAIAVGSTALLSLVTKNKRLQETSIIWLGSLALNSVVTDQLKKTFQRHRPNTGDPYDVFDWRGGPRSNNSFPSAHTSNIFTTATVFATLYSDHRWVPYVAYGIASLTGLSRIYNNAHWASDVMAGAAVGYLSAKSMTFLYRKMKHKFVFLPGRSAGVTYVHLSYNF